MRSPTKREDGYGGRAKGQEKSEEMQDRDDRPGRIARNSEIAHGNRAVQHSPDTREKRSPSPYSRRLALTRGMG